MAEVDAGAVAPVVPVTPAAEAAPVLDPTAGSEPVAPEGEQPSKPERTFTQKEVDDIASKRAAQAERRALKIAREAAQAEREFQARQQPRERSTEPQDGEPDPTKLAPVDYLKALVKWERAQERTKADNEAKTEQQQRSERDRAAFVQEKIMAPGIAKHADFEDVVFSHDAITEVMVAAASRLKNGADALYHLGLNRAEAERIARLPDIEQAWEIRDIGSKLAAPPATTKTPAPIVPNGGNTAVSKSMLDMNQDEFEKHRQARLAKKR